MTNYICINGNKTELTEEQLKQLGIEVPKASPFERVKKRKQYYVIDPYGAVSSNIENDDSLDIRAFNIGNYCTDKAIMKQRALHETLNRLLWRYAMENGGEGNYEIGNDGNKFIVQNAIYKYFGQTFCTYKVAENAIKEIVEPFMAAHPDFKF